MSRFHEYPHYDALGLAELVRSGDISPKELLAEARARLEAVDARFNAVVHLSDTLPNALIGGLDKTSVFCGVPFLVKDLMLPFKGMPLSNGTKAMKEYYPEQNSKMADRLTASGLITFGKTTTSELGASSLTKTVAFGETLNPWDVSKNAGGSSGGSSVVLATRVVPMAYASDGGGSIRLPASYCGIFGFKPSRGINQYEDMSKAWGGAVVSHAATRSVRDSAAYLDLVSGNIGEKYSATDPHPSSYLHAATREDRQLRIGVITDAPTQTDVHPHCRDAALHAANICEDFGHQVEPTAWNFEGRALMRAFLRIVMHYTHRDVQAIATLLDVRKADLAIELNTTFMSAAGSGISHEEVTQSLAVWEKASSQLSELHQQFDVILTPTVATPPLHSDALDPSAFEKLLMKVLLVTGLAKRSVNDKSLEMLIDKSLYQTPFTPIANMTGQPAMSVPLYWDEHGLPHGAHFMAKAGDDGTLLMLAHQLEREKPWADRLPIDIGG